MHPLSIAATRAGRFLLDALLPPRCLNCGEAVADPGALCPACWGRLAFLDGPLCSCCGHPFDHEAGPGALCGSCAAARPPFRRARAVLRYEEGCRELILRFKHADRTDVARPWPAGWVAAAPS